jgi:hypothetical protein
MMLAIALLVPVSLYATPVPSYTGMLVANAKPIPKVINRLSTACKYGARGGVHLRGGPGVAAMGQPIANTMPYDTLMHK